MRLLEDAGDLSPPDLQERTKIQKGKKKSLQCETCHDDECENRRERTKEVKKYDSKNPQRLSMKSQNLFEMCPEREGKELIFTEGFNFSLFSSFIPQ